MGFWTRPIAALVLRPGFDCRPLAELLDFDFKRERFDFKREWAAARPPPRAAPPAPPSLPEVGQATPHARILLSTGQLPRIQKAYRYYDTNTMPDPRAVFPLALEVLMPRCFETLIVLDFNANKALMP